MMHRSSTTITIRSTI
uniref:Uncharacterized protein n=1 Tax=Romanomermis culicivorax TaxID=13658 RepID=A0A915JK35_ROMCU